MWNGPAPARGYHEALCPQGVHNHFPAFRRYREYAGGSLADMGAHHFDIAQWGLGRDGSGPVEVNCLNCHDGSNPHLSNLDGFEPVYTSVERNLLSSTGSVKLAIATAGAIVLTIPITWVYFITSRARRIDRRSHVQAGYRGHRDLQSQVGRSARPLRRSFGRGRRLARGDGPDGARECRTCEDATLPRPHRVAPRPAASRTRALIRVNSKATSSVRLAGAAVQEGSRHDECAADVHERVGALAPATAG